MTYVAKSSIHGKGVFSSKNMKSGDNIGVAVLDINPLKRTEVGKMINHSDSASSVLRENGDAFSLFASKDIKKGDEITVDYYQAEEELGTPIDTGFLHNQNRMSKSMKRAHAKIKLSKYDDLFDFEVLQPLTEIPEEILEDETGEVDTAANIGAEIPLAKKREAPKPVEPVLKDVIEPLDWSFEELEEALKELEAAKRRPALSKRALRRGVKEEYVWMCVGGRLLVDKNVENEKELIGVGHSGLADKAGVDPKHEYPRGFVTYYTNGDIEVQTYGVSFWEMPTRVQNRVENWFELSPGQYKVEPPLALPPGTQLLLAKHDGVVKCAAGEIARYLAGNPEMMDRAKRFAQHKKITVEKLIQFLDRGNMPMLKRQRMHKYLGYPGMPWGLK